MEAWRTTCPRLTIWEDAIADGLVSVESAKSNAGVVVTERGRALLQATAEKASRLSECTRKAYPSAGVSCIGPENEASMRH